MSTLVRSEARPPYLTLYVEIPLGNRANNLTGIFFPRQYDSASPLNIMLYLRGWTADAVSIDRFWSDARQPQSLLREKINSSGRNLVLVAPTLGTRSEAGWLVHSGGPEAYLDRVIDAVRFNSSGRFHVRDVALEDVGDDDEADFLRPCQGQCLIDNLVLAAHSGGGTRMTSLAKNLGRYAGKLREMWGFDCTYVTSDVLDLVNLARGLPGAGLHYHYIAGSPTDQVATMLKRHAAEANLSNVSVQPTPPGVVHEWVPSAYLESRIRAVTGLL